MTSVPQNAWAHGVRVPVSGSWDGAGELVPVSEARGGFWWPSAEFPLVEVDFLTQGEAEEVAAYAREQLFGWLAGGGMHPVSIAFRWVVVVSFFRMEGEIGLSRDVVAAHAGRISRAWEGLVMAAIGNGVSVAGIDGVLRGAANEGRYERLSDSRTLGDLLAWCASESVEVPVDGFASADAGGFDGVASGAHALQGSRTAERSETGDRMGTNDECSDFQEGFETDCYSIAQRAMVLLCKWLGRSKRGLLPVLQRYYGLWFWRYGEGLGQMNGREFGALLGVTRAAFCEMTTRFFEEPGEMLMGFVPKCGGQKCAESSPVYAANAAKHKPRQQLGGDAGLAAAERPPAVNEEEGTPESRARAADWRQASLALEYGEHRFPLRGGRQRRFFEELRGRYLSE